MNKKTFAHCALGILATLTGLNAINWNTAGTDGDWNDAASWDGGVVPTAAEEAKINRASNVTVSGVANANKVQTGTTSTLTVNSGGLLTVASDFLIGQTGSNTAGNRYGTVELNTGGEIVVTTSHVQIGSWDAGAQESTLNISGGTFTVSAKELWVGRGAAGTLNLSGGTVELNNSSWQTLRIGDNQGDGTVNMTGGTLNTYGLRMDNNSTGNSNLNIDGGTLTVDGDFASAIDLNDNAEVAISDGVFKWEGDRVSDFDGLITGGFITFSTSSVSTISATAEDSWTSTDGSTILYADYGELTSGYTTLWASSAVPEPSSYALLFGSFLFAWVMLRRR
jgi:hypothetical protein